MATLDVAYGHAFDASDRFKALIRLHIEVIIFQFFVWEITELMLFFTNGYGPSWPAIINLLLSL